MFETFGEFFVLATVVLVSVIAGWAAAERRVVSSISSSYELQMISARRRINQLEAELGGSHLEPVSAWSDFELESVNFVDPGLAHSA